MSMSDEEFQEEVASLQRTRDKLMNCENPKKACTEFLVSAGILCKYTILKDYIDTI